MRVRTIWNNVYSILKEQPKNKILFLFLTILFFTFLLFLKDFELKKVSANEGIYSCSKGCTLKAYIPYEEAKKLKNNLEMKIDNTVYPLKIKEFGDTQVIENVVAVQLITLEIPKLGFYEKQTIPFEIILEKESILKTLFYAMKGGDA